MVRLTRCWHENFEIHDWANIVTQPTELLPLPAVNLYGTPGQVLSTHLRVSRAQACVLRTDTVWLPVLEGMVSRVSSHPNKTCLVAIPQFSSSTNLGLACQRISLERKPINMCDTVGMVTDVQATWLR